MPVELPRALLELSSALRELMKDLELALAQPIEGEASRWSGG